MAHKQPDANVVSCDKPLELLGLHRDATDRRGRDARHIIRLPAIEVTLTGTVEHRRRYTFDTANPKGQLRDSVAPLAQARTTLTRDRHRP
jgi:hypothetical protein